MAAGAAAWFEDADAAENQWRRTFCQVPFPAIYAHAERGKRSLRRVVELFRRKAACERSGGAELRALLLEQQDEDGGAFAALEDLEEPGSSLRRAMRELRAFADAAAAQQLLLATVLEEQVAEPLAALQDASAVYVCTLRDEIQAVNDAYDEATALHKEVGGPNGSFNLL